MIDSRLAFSTGFYFTILAVLLISLFTFGCASTEQQYLSEPIDTMFTTQCLQGRMLSSECRCIQEKLFKTLRDEKLVQMFLMQPQAIQGIVNQCREESMKKYPDLFQKLQQKSQESEIKAELET